MVTTISQGPKWRLTSLNQIQSPIIYCNNLFSIQQMIN